VIDTGARPLLDQVTKPLNVLSRRPWLSLFSARARPLAAFAGALLTLCSAESRAEQFILFDATFSYTWDDAVNAKPSKSHYYVNEGNWLNKQRPANWMSPVNYRDGKVHIRAEVLEKPPGTQQAGWGLCYVANVGDYGCPYTDYYTKPGVYERDVDMHAFYNNATLQWDHGVKQVDLVYTVNGSGSGHITNFPELKDLTTPTKVRITMVQVSAGATYDASILGTGGSKSEPGPEPARDGGAVEVGDDSGAGSVDTGTTPEMDAAPTGTGAAGAAGGAGGSSGGGGGGPAGSGGVDATGGTAPTPPPAATAGGGGAGGVPVRTARGSGCSVAANGPPGDGVGGLLALALLGLAAGRCLFRERG
jgi:hypothetical protein